VVVYATRMWARVGSCDKFYFAFKFEVWMWVQIYQIFEGDWIPFCHSSNYSNLNTDKLNTFEVDQI
jgi:hypothetical protein